MLKYIDVEMAAIWLPMGSLLKLWCFFCAGWDLTWPVRSQNFLNITLDDTTAQVASSTCDSQ